MCPNNTIEEEINNKFVCSEKNSNLNEIKNCSSYMNIDEALSICVLTRECVLVEGVEVLYFFV
jgi:hypothetical protein